MYFGQGLCKNSVNLLGYEFVLGEKYEMYKIGWKDMIQLCLGVIWEYEEVVMVFVNYVSYNFNVSLLVWVVFWDCNM